jgi:HEAT repeat protein
METIAEILSSKLKPKEKVTVLADRVSADPASVAELIRCFEEGNKSEQGACMEALGQAIGRNPVLGKRCLDFIVRNLDSAAPRVRWEAARAIAEIASVCTDRLSDALPKLLRNTEDSGTVVRWSAARALAAIAASSPVLREKLVPSFREILKREQNNGVRKIYQKALG